MAVRPSVMLSMSTRGQCFLTSVTTQAGSMPVPPQ
uniref:Uncharacterized protein n=1 Tax=Anguilla anguilla TaxID=7936 RepID=A0A0E9XG11_ANGAN